jgi:AbiU2
MAIDSSNKQIEAEYVFRIINDFELCKLDWCLYTDLYLQGSARVNTLNSKAPHFFARVQSNLMENTIIRISRLTDRYQQKDKKNLTLESLKEDGADVFGISEQYGAVQSSVENIRKVRHKVYAHRDLQVAIAEDPSTLLGTIFFNDITHSIDLIESFINAYCDAKGFNRTNSSPRVDINGIISSS